MAEIDIPDSVHDRVKDYSQVNGISVIEGYVELIECGLDDMMEE